MPCAELKNIELERATITSAVDVAAGLFKPATRTGQSAAAIRPAAAADSAALPPDARADADAGLEHQRRAVAADGELERQVPRRRQRRLGGLDSRLRRHAGSAAPRLCDGRDGHGAFGGRRPSRHVRARPPREDRRLRVSRAARHDGEVEAAHRRVLRGAARLLVLQRVLDGRPARRHGRTALSRRLRRHHRGRAREPARAHAHGRRPTAASGSRAIPTRRSRKRKRSSSTTP